MSESEVIEIEPKEPFNRADCVRHTARTFSPYPSLLWQEIGTRYLTDRTSGWRFEDLDAAVAQRISSYSDPGVDLTNERREFDEQEKQARRNFGPIVVTHARQLGLVETITPEQAKTYLAVAPDVDLVERVDSSVFDGWDVLSSKEDNKPMLLVPTKSEDGKLSFETVSLDDLYNRDPDFLPQKIRDYEKKYAMRALANSSAVTYNLNLYQVPEAELLPEFMRELARIANPEQKEKEVQPMLVFMNRMVRLGYEYPGTVSSFQQKLSMTKRDMGDGRNAYLEGYLKHMAECPTQTKEAHQRNAGLKQAYDALLSVTKPADPLDQGTKDPVTRVLRFPYYYLYLDRAEEERAAGREQDQKVIDFIDKTSSIANQTQFLEALQQELPDFHATLIRFQEWLGTDYSKKSKLDNLISETAVRIRIPFGGENFDLKQLNKTLSKQLKLVTFTKTDEFEGVYNTVTHEGAHLNNPHLEAVLPLMAIKAAQAKAENTAKVELCQRLTQELIQSYKEENNATDKQIQRIKKQKQDLASLKEQTGITDEEIAGLIELTTLEDSREDKGDGSVPQIDRQLYTSLFNALVLKKQGLADINIHSPPFKGLLKSLFPGGPEAVWQKL